MAGQKISLLNDAGNLQSGDKIPLARNGSTYNIDGNKFATKTQLDALSAVVEGNVTLSHGNHTGAITSIGLQTTYNQIVPSSKGGAGSVVGILKADGSGNVTAALSGIDYLTALSVDNKIDKPASPIGGQVLTYSGTEWIAANPPTGGGGGTMENLSGAIISVGNITTYNQVVPSNKGGAGTVNGLLKANGSGTVSAAVSGVDYVTTAQLSAKIDKPSGATTNQVLTYNGTNWIAAKSAVETIFDPATHLATMAQCHYGFTYTTNKGVYRLGYVDDEFGSPYYNRPGKLPFFNNYLKNNPTVVPIKTYFGLRNKFVLLSNGTLWGLGDVDIWAFAASYQSRYFVPLNTGSLSGKFITDFSANDCGRSGSELTIAARCSDGTAYIWGWNGYGQFGNGTTTSSRTPVQINIQNKLIAQVSVGGCGTGSGKPGVNTLVRLTEGTLYGAGWNSYGTLGVGNTTTQTSFVQCKETATQPITGVAEILEYHTANTGYTRFVKKTSTNTLWGAGLNDTGQLGNGTTTNSYYFVKPSSVGTGIDLQGNPIIIELDVKKLVGAGWSTNTTMAALTYNNTVYTWGDNRYGTTGQGLVTDPYVPTLVTVYQKDLTTTEALPLIKNIFGTNAGNQGAIGLISNDGDVYTAGTYTYNPISLLKSNDVDSEPFKRFEKRYDVSNIEEGIFYDNCLDGTNPGWATGCIVRDSSGIIWGWGVQKGGILGVGLDADSIPHAMPLNLYCQT